MKAGAAHGYKFHFKRHGPPRVVSHYVWQYLLGVVKFDTGFNYYARFAQLAGDRGVEGEEGYIDVEFDQLGNTRWNSRMIDKLC